MGDRRVVNREIQEMGRECVLLLYFILKLIQVFPIHRIDKKINRVVGIDERDEHSAAAFIDAEFGVQVKLMYSAFWERFLPVLI